MGDLDGLLVGSTVAAFKCDSTEELSWLEHADEWRARGAWFACALQTGQGHDAKLGPLGDELNRLDAQVWRFSIDQGETEVTSQNRLIGICTGRNLIHEIAQRDPAIEAILFLDTDVTPPVDLPDKLLEVNHPLVGGNVPHYCLDGPKVEPVPMRQGWTWLSPSNGRCYDVRRPFPEGADVREHWNTAGCLLVSRAVFRSIRWRWDQETGTTDDPCFQLDAQKAGFGMTWVRHDVAVLHDPLVPMERRGHDRSVIH